MLLLRLIRRQHYCLVFSSTEMLVSCQLVKFLNLWEETELPFDNRKHSKKVTFGDFGDRKAQHVVTMAAEQKLQKTGAMLPVCWSRGRLGQHTWCSVWETAPTSEPNIFVQFFFKGDSSIAEKSNLLVAEDQFPEDSSVIRSLTPETTYQLCPALSDIVGISCRNTHWLFSPHVFWKKKR